MEEGEVLEQATRGGDHALGDRDGRGDESLADLDILVIATLE
jgi:hypothetical protein